METSDLRAIILQAKDAWVKGNGTTFANLFTEDGEFIVPGQHWQGRAAIQAESDRFLEKFTVTIEIRTILVEGNKAAVEWDWYETSKSASQTVSQAQDAILIEFEAGKIRRWREYIDNQTTK